MDFISIQQGRFWEGTEPWSCKGANCYYLMTRAADPNLRHEVLSVLDSAVALGLTCIRTWAFAEGEGWNHLQPAPGQYDERVFAGLDWVVAEAKARGLRLILVLGNYFSDYGGLQQYVSWNKGCPKEESCAEQFYSDSKCTAMFNAYVHAVLRRRNTLTGILYCEEPAITAWDICNEPRCKLSSGVDPEAMHAWIAHTAAYIKALDNKHLVTVGEDGFFGSSSPGFLSANPYDCKAEGCDFWRTLCTPGVDFASFHLHPDHWLSRNTSSAEVAHFVQRWISEHAIACREAGKPWVCSEFGSRQQVCSEWKGCALQHTEEGEKQASQSGSAALERHVKEQAKAGCMQREALYEEVLSLCLDGCPSQHLTAPTDGHDGHEGGVLFWMLAADSYPDYDGFTIYPPNSNSTSPQTPPWIPADSGAVSAMVQRWCKR